MVGVVKIPDSLEQASRVKRLDDQTFAAELVPSFCIGTVPNGGYVATIFMRVANAYLATRNQPDTIVGHWEFLNRTEAGPAILKVEEVKPGKAMSVLHISLYQGNLLPEHPWIASAGSGSGKPSERLVAAYLTNRFIKAEKGISIPTGWSISPPLPPVEDFSKLGSGQDPHWESLDLILNRSVHALQQMQYFLPRGASSRKPITAAIDLWVRLANHEPFTSSSLGFVIDATPATIIELYRPPPKEVSSLVEGFAYNSSFWYPTLTMNVDVKKALPEKGTDWLLLKTNAKQILNGRYDIEVVVVDMEGDLVAISHHVAMIVDSARNSANRQKPQDAISKI